jgi:2-polyprenyl-6-hydroxyphenyl methylase/3-demethylubiquinone-9 3-methyltransferase
MRRFCTATGGTVDDVDFRKTRWLPGNRFRFGQNWQRFLAVVDDERISAAEMSISELLDADFVKGARFLDAGSGSGMFSLAARNLGATVVSFDFDPDSVGCTQALKQRFWPEDPAWTVSEGSLLDKGFLETLGTFDIVYSWGVLHHTGSLHEAMHNVAHLVASGGKLCVAIYNYQGLATEA